MKKYNYPPYERLPLPARTIQLPNRMVELYEIPYRIKATVLKALHPYIHKPSLEEEMYDIHADKKFIVKEFLGQSILFRGRRHGHRLGTGRP